MAACTEKSWHIKYLQQQQQRAAAAADICPSATPPRLLHLLHNAIQDVPPRLHTGQWVVWPAFRSLGTGQCCGQYHGGRSPVLSRGAHGRASAYPGWRSASSYVGHGGTEPRVWKPASEALDYLTMLRYGLTDVEIGRLLASLTYRWTVGLEPQGHCSGLRAWKVDKQTDRRTDSV